MIIIPVKTWLDYKNLVSSKSLKPQYYETLETWEIFSKESETFIWQIALLKESDDAIDFENNYKNNYNKSLEIPRDSDGSPIQRNKITVTGWHYQLHCIEFETSQLNSIYSKDTSGTDFGFTTIKCYDINDNELTVQLDCDINAVKTVIDWEPNHDYEIIGGSFKQFIIPVSDIRLWIIGIPDIPSQYGGSKLFAANINLKYIGMEEGIKVDGRAPKYLSYDNQNHTNKLRLVLKHNEGFKHKIMIAFELFKA